MTLCGRPFSLRTLVAVQNRIEAVRRDESFVHPFSREQIAIMSYALGVLASERIAAGERLTAEDDEALALGAARVTHADSCRRCSECTGELHHWLTSMPECPDEGPFIPCKHCPARADVCVRCGDAPVFPPRDDDWCEGCRDAVLDQLDEALCSLLHRGDETGEHGPEAHLALARAREKARANHTSTETLRRASGIVKGAPADAARDDDDAAASAWPALVEFVRERQKSARELVAIGSACGQAIALELDHVLKRIDDLARRAPRIKP